MFKLILVKGVKPVFFIEILSVLCMSYHTQATMLPWYHAKRYPGFQSNINWARFLPPSPHDMSFGDYHGKNWEFEPTEGGIEDTSMKGSNQDDLDGIRGKETEYSGVENGASRPASESPASARSKSTANNVDQAAGKSQPQEMNFHQLKRLLSQIYLIRTPYGYVLGRTNPTISTTSIARRYIQTSKPRMNSAYGCFMHNMKSEGYDVVAFQRIANAIVCQEKYCQEDEQCKYFDYSKNGGLCILKTEKASTNTSFSEGHIFGPQYCPDLK